MRRLALAIALVVLSSAGLVAQVTATPARPDSAPRPRPAEHVPKRSRADTLRGSFTTPGRKWWDVTFYDLHVAIEPNDSSIAGYNGITYKVLEPATEMQIDLMEPLVVDSMKQDARRSALPARLQPREREAAVPPGEVDAQVLRVLVRSVPMVRGWLPQA